ncbi:O-antigen ligase family protein [Winogradskyella sp.]|nr:O-antigen ligase family protein [Winogradskyella sp.]MDC1229933.1 O-antigen ligase family protein [bacterium]MDC1503656.1 O-antigen ligase family protein [Winogradskyella sp.]
MIGYFLLVLISLIYTNNLDRGIGYLTTTMPFIILPLIFSTIKIERSELKQLFKGYIIWLFILILFSELTIIINILNNGDSLFLLFRKDYSYITLGEVIGIHPPYMVLLMSFPIFYIIEKFEKTGINKYLQIFILLVFFFYIIHLSSRLPMVSVLSISFLLIYKKLNQKIGIIKSIISLIAILILTSLILYNIRSTRYRFQELFGMQYANGIYIKSAPLKIFQWTAGLKANNNLIVGNGMGDANNDITKSNYNEGLYKFVELKYNAHNQYIQTFVGIGILGVLCLFFILYYFLVSNSSSYLSLTSKAFFVYLLVVFLTESYLERHHGLVFISFIVCLTFSKKNKKLQL